VEVIPSIDIKDGRCVRLYQGDYDKLTMYDEDPRRVARRWEELGAASLHVVDLDGAAGGAPSNLPIVADIVRALSIPVQVGGGMRSLDIAGRWLDLGVARVVWGTAAVRDPATVEEAIARWGDRVVLGVDARGGRATTNGWRETSDVDAYELARHFVARGVHRVIYTDVSRDGTLTEPNYAAMAEMVAAAAPAMVVGSGGVANLEHVKRLADTGVSGVIVGRALYAGTLDLREAIAWTTKSSSHADALSEGEGARC
jgi:phosphoribosylformimino-5-aminoimidazole carboxamide ribotide isomerase